MDMAEALLTASELDSRRQAAGIDQGALDKAARGGFGFPIRPHVCQHVCRLPSDTAAGSADGTVSTATRC